jgi:hypothetical protein
MGSLLSRNIDADKPDKQREACAINVRPDSSDGKRNIANDYTKQFQTDHQNKAKNAPVTKD